MRRPHGRIGGYGPRLVESVPAFLDELAGRLVPGCDRAVVRAVFARASAGYAGPRGRDGLRVTAITPSGVPFEASVTGGAGRSPAALRYVTETATAMPFFGPRLVAQRAALDDLVGWLPPPARAAAGELCQATDVLFPDPSVVPARTRFATTFGVVHRDDVPDGLAGLKLYLNVRAVDPAAPAADDPVSRLGRRWPAVADLHDLVDDLVFLVPHFTTVEVDAAGRLGHDENALAARPHILGCLRAAPLPGLPGHRDGHLPAGRYRPRPRRAPHHRRRRSRRGGREGRGRRAGP